MIKPSPQQERALRLAISNLLDTMNALGVVPHGVLVVVDFHDESQPQGAVATASAGLPCGFASLIANAPDAVSHWDSSMRAGGAGMANGKIKVGKGKLDS